MTKLTDAERAFCREVLSKEERTMIVKCEDCGQKNRVLSHKGHDICGRCKKHLHDEIAAEILHTRLAPLIREISEIAEAMSEVNEDLAQLEQVRKRGQMN